MRLPITSSFIEGVPVVLMEAMAAGLAVRLKVPAYTVDPVVVDEFSPQAELSGHAAIQRKSTSHALSVKAAVRRFAADNGRDARRVNAVVGHLGGGYFICALPSDRVEKYCDKVQNGWRKHVESLYQAADLGGIFDAAERGTGEVPPICR